METLISLGYYVSTIGFLIATVVTFNAARTCSQSGLKTVLNYLFIGTTTFLVITIFQKLSSINVFVISPESTDVWWHIMFYMAMISFYLGFKALARLGSTDGASTVSTDSGMVWGTVSLIVLVTAFVFASSSESTMQVYTSSRLGELGLHHFIAFVLAGIVGAYLFSAKLFLGQIGRAIASPMIIAIWALAAQHLWELLYESLKVVVVTSEAGEGVEKIFLVIAAACIVNAGLRLKSLSKTA
ncbi:MAG: hypothetical protein Q7S75_01300 [bacterium]|nr:hypothetical protein [bacterium]